MCAVSCNVTLVILFYLLQIVCGGSVLVFVLLYITLCPFLVCNHLDKEDMAICFAFNCLPGVL